MPTTIHAPLAGDLPAILADTGHGDETVMPTRTFPRSRRLRAGVVRARRNQP